MAIEKKEIPLRVFEFTAHSSEQFSFDSEESKTLFERAASWRVATVYGGMRWRQQVAISIKPGTRKAAVVEILRCMADALEASPQDPISMVTPFGASGGELRGWYDPRNHRFEDIFSSTAGNVSRVARAVGSWYSGFFSKKQP